MAFLWHRDNNIEPMTPIERFMPLIEAGHESDWRSALFKIASGIGFESTLAAIVPQTGMPLEKAFLRSNYDERWRAFYDDNHLAHIDPTVAHCITRTTSLIWSPDIFCSKEQRHLYEEASSFGLRSGVTLPIHGPKGEVGILCFVSDTLPGKTFRQEADRLLPELSLLRDIVFDTGIHFAKPSDTCEQHFSLTARERECLHWAAAGKSTWEIAQILHRSESVVNFHFSNIRYKFDVTTRREAVVKAIRLGLINPGC